MPQITEAQWNTLCKQDAVGGLFLFYGTENYIKAHFAERLKKKTVAPEYESFNFQRFEGKQASVDEIHEAVEAFPFMSESKCVLVQDMQLDALGDADMQKLTQLLSDVPAHCALIFLLMDVEVPAKKTKKWNAVFSLFLQHGSVLECNRKDAAQLRQIVIGGVQKRGCTMNAAVADYFIANVGNDLNLLLNEVEKLCAYAPQTQLTREAVDAVCIKSLEASVFNITRTLLRGHLGQALSILDILKNQRAEPVMIHGAVVSSFVNMYRVRVAEAAGKKADSISAVFPGTSPYALRYAAQDAGKLPPAKLRGCLEELHRADALLKGSAVDNWLVLEQTLAAIFVLLKGK